MDGGLVDDPFLPEEPLELLKKGVWNKVGAWIKRFVFFQKHMLWSCAICSLIWDQLIDTGLTQIDDRPQSSLKCINFSKQTGASYNWHQQEWGASHKGKSSSFAFDICFDNFNKTINYFICFDNFTKTISMLPFTNLCFRASSSETEVTNLKKQTIDFKVLNIDSFDVKDREGEVALFDQIWIYSPENVERWMK